MDLREIPIIRPVLEHTGALDGDDTGYRDVAVSPTDDADPDLLVPIDDGLLTYPVYARGRLERVTPFYGDGLGGPNRLLLRAPALAALIDADRALARFGRRLLVLDAWRPAWVQAALWRDVLLRLAGPTGVEGLSPAHFIRLGRRADDTASFCAAVRDDRWYRACHRIAQLDAEALDAAAEELGMTSAAVTDELVTFKGNLGAIKLSFDTAANTAHGGGGAADLWLVDASSGSPVNLGVPFDSTASAAVVDFFEWASVEQYREQVATDASLRSYLSEFGIDDGRITVDDFEAIRAERRLLFHALRSVGASYFSLGREIGEPWHYNLGNERGGKQAAFLPSAGSACHSLLKNIRGADGRWIAAWGNAAAHRLGEAPVRG